MVDTVALVPNEPIEIEERKQLDTFIDDLIAKHSANAEMMNLMALEATSLATSVSARSKDLEEQGFLTRLKRDFTGENQRVSARNSDDLARSQYLGQKMLNKLAENNLMTYQMTVALGDKVNRVIADVGDTQRDIAELHHTLATFFSSIRQTLEAKFNSLERNDDLLFWKETLEFQPVFQGKMYAELTRPEKMVCLANEFFHHSHQQWSPRDLSFFKSVMSQVGHHPTEEKVALKELYQAHQAQPELLNQLFLGVDDEFYLDSSEANTPVLMGFRKLQSLADDESHVVDTILEYAPASDKKEVSISLMSKYVQRTAGRDLDREMSFFDVVMNLVEDLVIYKQVKDVHIMLANQDEVNDIIEDDSPQEEESSVSGSLVYKERIEEGLFKQSGGMVDFSLGDRPFLLLGVEFSGRTDGEHSFSLAATDLESEVINVDCKGDHVLDKPLWVTKLSIQVTRRDGGNSARDTVTHIRYLALEEDDKEEISSGVLDISPKAQKKKKGIAVNARKPKKSKEFRPAVPQALTGPTGLLWMMMKNK